MRAILAVVLVMVLFMSTGNCGTEIEPEALAAVVSAMGRLEALLVSLLALQSFAVGLLFWRLFVLSKSQRNIL